MECMDCKISTRSEYYMVHEWLWKRVNPNISGLLCIGCLENRLGRELTKTDFTDAPINSTDIFDKSRRLLDRLGLKTADDLISLKMKKNFDKHLIYNLDNKMNSKINLGATKDGEEVVVDLVQDNIKLILLLGESASGKSVFHYNLYNQLIDQNTPNELSFIFIDNTRVDFSSFASDYVKEYTVGQEETMQELNNIQNELQSDTTSKNSLLVVHIEECNQFAQEPEKMAGFFAEFIKSKQNNNIIIVYSTSRPAEDAVPDWLINAADLKVVFKLANSIDAQRLNSGPEPLTFSEPGQRLLLFKDQKILCQPLPLNA